MTDRDIISAMAWIIGIGTTALGALLFALARWVMSGLQDLRQVVSEEMRSFDVRIARLETIQRLRREEAESAHNRRAGETGHDQALGID